MISEHRTDLLPSLVSLIGVSIFISLVAAGIIPLVMAVKVKVSSLRILSLLLGTFAMTHAFYHLSLAYQNFELGELVFEPVSVMLLLSFGLYYSKKGVA